MPVKSTILASPLESINSVLTSIALLLSAANLGATFSTVCKTRSIVSLAFLLVFSIVNNSSNFALASSYSFFFFADFYL